MHDFFGAHVRFDDRMHVIGAYVCGPETPTVVQTDVAESIEYGDTTVTIQEAGRHLVHLFKHRCDTFRTGFCQSAPGTVVSVD